MKTITPAYMSAGTPGKAEAASRCFGFCGENRAKQSFSGISGGPGGAKCRWGGFGKKHGDKRVLYIVEAVQ